MEKRHIQEAVQMLQADHGDVGVYEQNWEDLLEEVLYSLRRCGWKIDSPAQDLHTI